MSDIERAALPQWLGWARLAIGLAQGIAVYVLSEQREALDPALNNALWLTCVFVPVVVIGALGALRPLTLAIWTGVAVVVTASLGVYEVYRIGDELNRSNMPYGPLIVVIPALLFVAHHLVAAGDEARKWIAPYERYFDLGWRHGAQLALACLFTGAFWAVLMLGAALFNLIGIALLSEIFRESWFALPATFAVFAAAIHLTDLRAGLVRGARALGLALLSWLLPAMAGLAAAFFLALPFTGLEPLWATRAAALILICSAAVLVVLINASYQDGQNPPGAILRWSARLASVLLTPLAVLAAYALYLRIDQYGLTPERVFAVAVLIVGFCYAVSYLAAAFWREWMKPLERGNIAAAVVLLLVAVAVFSPFADPARMSVSDQVSRLESGRTAPEHFDLVFLRFDGGRYGNEVLQRLRDDRSSETAIALSDRAREVLALENRWQAHGIEQNVPPPVVIMHPEGAPPPEGLFDLTNEYGAASNCRRRGVPCHVFQIDVVSGGAAEFVVVSDRFISVYARGEDGAWQLLANGHGSGSEAFPDAIEAGSVVVVPPSLNDLRIGDERVELTESDNDVLARAAIAPAAATDD